MAAAHVGPFSGAWLATPHETELPCPTRSSVEDRAGKTRPDAGSVTVSRMERRQFARISREQSILETFSRNFAASVGSSAIIFLTAESLMLSTRGSGVAA